MQYNRYNSSHTSTTTGLPTNRPRHHRRGLVSSGGRKQGMYCRDCAGMQTHHDGDGLPHHYCTYTGVTVCPLVIGAGADERDNASRHEADNPTAVCPRNLQTMIGSEDGRRQVRGVLRQVEERGELDALLATYQARTVEVLMKVLRRVRPSTTEMRAYVTA